MIKKSLITAAIASSLCLTPLLASASNQASEMYGSQLMTKQERMEFRGKMRAAKSMEERQAIRKAHHEEMKMRAEEKGITLPEPMPDDNHMQE